MKINTKLSRKSRSRRARTSQRGTAIIIAIMVMALLAIFVAATISRVTNETLMMSNDQANTEAYFVAQASLEHMSRNFSDVFDVRITPTAGDITNIQNDVPPGYTDFTITQVLQRENPGDPPEQTTVDVSSPFAGLVALREGWRMDATALGPSNAEVRLTRTLNNYTIPIFQFGIFYDDPQEHHPGPAFNFGGRVHTNGDIYLMAGNTNTRFRDRVTAAGEVVVDVARNGSPWTTWGQHVRVNDGTGTYRIVDHGSVVGGPDTTNSDPDEPNGTVYAAWPTFAAQFRGNLVARTPRLQLPLQLGGDPPIAIIRRPDPTDPPILRDSRYGNKPCIRISLSNSQAQLPGASGGVQLNAVIQPNAANTVGGGAKGYWPSARGGGQPRAHKINGERLTTIANREVWIKVEAISTNPATLVPESQDITVDILSLGMTDRTPVALGSAIAAGWTGPKFFGDTDAIIKIQRFAIPGPPLKVNNANYLMSATENNTPNHAPQVPDNFLGIAGNASTSATRLALNRSVYSFIPATAFVPAGPSANVGANVVCELNAYLDSKESIFECPSTLVSNYGTNLPIRLTVPDPGAATSSARSVHLVPFPIMMFDTREGLYNDSLADTGATSWTSLYMPNANSQRVPVNGVMGMIDFDVANFRRLVSGAFDGTMPNGLTGASLPDNGGIGWIVYISDRRNDLDNDGQYDGENVYVANATDTTGFTIGEDVNHNSALDQSYDNAGLGNGESATYATGLDAPIAAVTDTRWNRRASRLINGARLPGTEFKGFTFACEQGVYIQGNYNATGVVAIGAPTPFNQYLNALGDMVPASVVADAVSILSNQWNDAKSFRWAFDFGTVALDGRLPTTDATVRTALLMGDTLSFDRNDGPNQGGGDWHLAGGVHNFKRFREDWGGRTVNYCGSLINLFNSDSNNGPFKCCNQVYTPPTRNWVFDEYFLDPRRLPPGTPFFQYINLTGFRRTYVQDS